MDYIRNTLNTLTKSRTQENPDNFTINESRPETLLKSKSKPQSLSQSLSQSKPQSLSQSKPRSLTKKNITTPILSAATLSPELNNNNYTTLSNSNTSQSPKIAVSQSKTIFFAILFTILAFIGYNIFTYLSDGSSYLIDLLKPIFNSVALLTGNTLKTTLDNTLSGTNKSLDITGETTKNVLNNATAGSKETINKLQNKKSQDLNTETNESETNESDTEIDNPKSINTDENTNSFCYIGKINDTRYCAKVLDDKYCLSEEIYPSMDICCLLYTSPSPRDGLLSRMPSSA